MPIKPTSHRPKPTSPRRERTSQFTLPDAPRAILVVRLTARGDVLLASPVVEALRRRYPGAHIAWAVEAHARDMIEHHEGIDEIIVWDRAAWKAMIRTGHWRALGRAFRELRARLRAPEFDVALDLQGLLRSGWVAWLSGAPVRIGLGSKEGSWMLMTGTVPRQGAAPGSTSLQYPYFAHAVGLPSDDLSLHLALGQEEEDFARRFVAEHRLAGGFAALAPFTTRPQKHWIEDRWAALAARIRAELGLPVVLLGGPADREAAGRIATAAGGIAAPHDRIGTPHDRIGTPREGIATPQEDMAAPRDGIAAPRESSANAAGGIAAPQDRIAAPQESSANARQRIANARGSPPLIDLTGRTRLGEAAAVVKRAGLFLGVDTCLSHVSVAFRRPSVLLVGSNIPYREAPHGRARIALELQPCAPCGNRPTCGGAFQCMRALDTDEVFELAKEAFEDA